MKKIILIKNKKVQNICNTSVTFSQTKEQNAITCYAGSFLLYFFKDEQVHSSENIRIQLLPALGGESVIDSLIDPKNDFTNNTCSTCHISSVLQQELLDFRKNNLTKQQLDDYDSLEVCSVVLTV